MKKGYYIVLQGVQGVGKTTQIDLLEQKLKQANIPTRKMREPDSQTDLTARNLRQMTQSPLYPMNTKTEVLLYNAARSQTLEIVRKMNDRGITTIVDHCYLTTLAVQYYARGDIEDYDAVNSIIDFTVGESEPDLIVILDVPVKTSLERLADRGQGERFDNVSHDFLKRERDGLLLEAKKRNLPVVDATKSIEAISEAIWVHVQALIEKGHSPKTKAAKVTSPTKVSEILETKRQPFFAKNAQGSNVMTEAGIEEISKYVTNPTGNVYAFNDQLAPSTIAAAMARLSRRGDDMRITLLDEFIGKEGKDEDLLKRVITAYGDDSVQQLAGLHFIVENASNLLTKKLEWGRLAAYLEQSTRYIFFDQKDKNGNFKYFTPRNLDAKTAKTYERLMDKIFGLYSKMVRDLTNYVRTHSTVPKNEQDIAWKGATRAQACDAIRHVLPVATKSTVGIFASGQAAESLYMHLMSDSLQESRLVGEDLLIQLREIAPVFFERADNPKRGGAKIAYKATTHDQTKQLTESSLQQNLSSANQNDVTLVDYWPKRELDIVPHILFEHSSLSLSEIQKQTNAWSYSQKEKVMKTYIGERLNRRHKPGRAFEQIHYSWEILCDYGIFRDLQRHRMVDDLAWQQLSPRYGYDMPELVEEAGLEADFQRCFDMSLQLYSQLQAAGYHEEAQYATLLGHKMRWKITYNAREAYHFHELRTAPQGHPGYRKLVKQMHDTVSEVHPLVCEGMIFVNKDEDEVLTRLAAEKYTQYKLQQLDSK